MNRCAQTLCSSETNDTTRTTTKCCSAHSKRRCWNCWLIIPLIYGTFKRINSWRMLIQLLSTFSSRLLTFSFQVEGVEIIKREDSFRIMTAETWYPFGDLCSYLELFFLFCLSVIIFYFFGGKRWVGFL